MSEAAQPALSRRPRRKRVSIVGVLGEILITVGVVILLFLGWQLWFNNIVSSATQKTAADALSQQWESSASPDPGASTPPPTSTDEPRDPGEPVVMSTPALDKAFANLIVPRLGADFKRPIAEGVGTAVLNNTKLGMGHYTGTQLPGAVGNFALASHRSAYGGAFHNIHQLVVGDSIYVETADGWYRYIFRDLEYVRASGVGVILPVPQSPDVAPTERLITLTSCNPFYSSAERIIAYGVYDTWYPRAGGPPPEIAQIASASGVQ
jgi:sortase A